MSSYICQNFQLSILYNFQFYHMVLKLVLYVDFPHMRIFPYDRDFFGSVVAGLITIDKFSRVLDDSAGAVRPVHDSKTAIENLVKTVKFS